ncbi:hypothetical protein GCM10025859_23890 [Alicyclobacillus fastidiosus]|nr:hypothetical protein GCM10025859_23890 [Alicyclobacillus fastidiosus]
MERDELASRAQQIGEKSVAMLSRLQERIPFIGDVRGLGAMVGVEFVRDSASKEPYPELVALISQKCFEKRLVTVKAGVYSNVIRLLCPLVITDEELEEGLARLESAITEAVAELS